MRRLATLAGSATHLRAVSRPVRSSLGTPCSSSCSAQRPGGFCPLFQVDLIGALGRPCQDRYLVGTNFHPPPLTASSEVISSLCLTTTVLGLVRVTERLLSHSVVTRP